MEIFMNLPNKLTLFRIILVPFFVWALYTNMYAALIIFIAASLTDQLDGHLARKHNQVTTFGKLMDPLADKILTLSAFVCFLGLGYDYVPAWLVVIIIARELLVTGIRLIALSENKVIAAGIWGKLKTVAQIAAIIMLMIDRLVPLEISGVKLTLVIMGIVFVLTLYSGIDYVVKNRDLLTLK